MSSPDPETREPITSDPSAEPSTDNSATPAVETPPSPAELTDLRARAARADEHWDRLVRMSADYENFKKRAARERQDAIRFANEGLIEKLIPVLDNFDAALAAAQQAQGTGVDALKTGILMIHSQLRSALTDSGLAEIDALNETFDPNWHEALGQAESAEVPEGRVLQQLRKGYKLRDRLLRPAGVLVAKPPAV